MWTRSAGARAALAALAAGVCACSARAPARALPVIKMDDAHLQMERPDGSAPEAYTLPPTDGFVLDGAGYALPHPPQLAGRAVNSIQIITGPGARFDLPWTPGAETYEISARTVRAWQGGKKTFAGLHHGARVIVAVGVATPPAEFSVVWAGVINVR